ncbi:MAG: response regulator, partial [Eubacteriales bacterium]
MYNILICDDERDIVSALKIYLSSEGYNPLEAYDGAAALELLRKNDISIVLLDVMMPVMDGIVTLSKLREESNVPVIMLTARGE